MSIYKLLTVSIFAFMTSSADAVAQAMTQDTFESRLFGLSEISHFGLDRSRFEALTQTQRSSVLEAKTVLLAFLKALQEKSGTPIDFLSSSLKDKYSNKHSLAESLIDEETSLLGLLITDFTVSEDSSQVQFACSFVLSAEGMVVIDNKKMLLIKISATWRVARIS